MERRNLLIAISLVINLSQVFIGCQKDDLELSSRSDTKNSDVLAEEQIENGRFIFSSKEALSATIEDLRKKEDEILEIEFERLYQNGFRSHRPIINSGNEALIAKLFNDYNHIAWSKEALDDEDNLDDEKLIDPDTLYKFADKRRQFFVHI